MRALWAALTKRRGRGPARRSRGGIALLVVLTTVLVLTILVSELSYTSTVRLMVAAHSRDRAQAVWLARSGVNLYRLILTANKQLEKSGIGESLQEYTGINIGDALWQLLPSINTGLLRMLFSAGGDASDLEEEDVATFKQTGKVSDAVAEESRQGGLFDDKNFLDFDGDFSAEITDEESKINVNNLANRDTTQSIQLNATALQLYGRMSGEENDEWFREHNLDRWELIANLADWVDQDNLRAAAQGGYEDNLYNRLQSPYLTKNAPFDTKEEIRLVEGWQDDVYDRFKDDLTIWGTGKININTASDEQIKGLIRAYVTPMPNDSTLELLVEQVRNQLMVVGSFKKGKEFTSFLEGLGYTVSGDLAQALSSSSYTFTLTSTGLVGDSAATITAVVDYGTKGGTVGKVLYWRED